MLYLYDDEQQALIALGKRLAEQRLSRNETQAVFAERLGVSRVTYGKMERGDPSIAVGHWIRSLGILNKLNQLDNLLKEADLFARHALEQRVLKNKRKRARKPVRDKL